MDEQRLLSALQGMLRVMRKPFIMVLSRMKLHTHINSMRPVFAMNRMSIK